MSNQSLPTLRVMVDRLQQQVDEYPELLSLAASQEAQDDGGASAGACLTLELAARFAAQASKQDSETERVHSWSCDVCDGNQIKKKKTSHLSASVERNSKIDL